MNRMNDVPESLDGVERINNPLGFSSTKEALESIDYNNIEAIEKLIIKLTNAIDEQKEISSRNFNKFLQAQSDLVDVRQQFTEVQNQKNRYHKELLRTTKMVTESANREDSPADNFLSDLLDRITIDNRGSDGGRH